MLNSLMKLQLTDVAMAVFLGNWQKEQKPLKNKTNPKTFMLGLICAWISESWSSFGDSSINRFWIYLESDASLVVDRS